MDQSEWKIEKFFITAVTLFLAIFTALHGQENKTECVYSIRGYNDSLPFANPQGIFFDTWTKEIYVCDMGNHQVFIFTEIGYPLYKFKHYVRKEKTGARMPGEPRNLVVNRLGKIFLLDNLSNFIDILDQRGRTTEIMRLNDIQELKDENLRPAFLAIDKDDNLFVATSGANPEILIFDKELVLTKRIGKTADSKLELESITGIWVDDSEKIYIADAKAQHCVQIITREGEFLMSFGGHDIQREDFSLPSGILTTAGGQIWVVDELRQVVKSFDEKGNFLYWIGGFGMGFGSMRYPRAITGDGENSLYVVERVGCKFQKFKVNSQVNNSGSNK